MTLRIAIAALAISACAKPVTYFKPGGHSSDEWHRDNGVCRSEAMRSLASCTGGAFWCQSLANETHEACLAGKGWYPDPR